MYQPRRVKGMLTPDQIVLYMVLAALFAIVYSLKRMYVLERRIASIEINIERLLELMAAEEAKIEKKEEEILAKVVPKKAAKKSTKKR